MSEHIWIICEDLLLTPLFSVTHEFKSMGKKTEDGREPWKLAVWVRVHVHESEIVKHFGWKHPHLYLSYIYVLNCWFSFSSVVTEMLFPRASLRNLEYIYAMKCWENKSNGCYLLGYKFRQICGLQNGQLLIVLSFSSYPVNKCSLRGWQWEKTNTFIKPTNTTSDIFKGQSWNHKALMTVRRCGSHHALVCLLYNWLLGIELSNGNIWLETKISEKKNHF